MAKRRYQPRRPAVYKLPGRVQFTPDPMAFANAGIRLADEMPGGGKSSPQHSNGWRCVACGKLLGVYRGEHMHVRIARNHEYLVSLPVTATCHGCGTLNEALGPARFKRNDDIPF